MGLGFRVWGLECGVEDLVLRVYGVGLRGQMEGDHKEQVQGLIARFRVWGSGLRV